MFTVNLINGNITIPLSDGGLSEGKITKAVNAFDSFTATVLPNSAGYDLLYPLKSKITVIDGTKIKFEGRILTVTPKMDNRGIVSKQIICEGLTAYLCDSIQPYTAERQYSGDDTKNGLQEFIDVILANHNAQVENEKKIYRGNVTVTTYDSGGVYKGLNYESTWQIISEKLIKVYGGEINIRKQSGTLYLDYKPHIGATRSTAITVGVNMQSAEKKLDATQVCSRLIPLGAKLTVTQLDDQGNEVEMESEERLTIASVNDNKIYIESDDAIDLYGICYKTVIFDDIHDANILLTRGTEYLATRNAAVATHTVTAVDMSYLGESVDEIEIFDSYPVTNTYIGITETLEVIKKTTDIFKPYSPTFTFGQQNVFLSDIMAGNVAEIAANQAEYEKSVTEQKNSVSTVYSYVNTTATSLQRNAETLVATAMSQSVSKSDYDSFSETVKNILQMDPSGTTMIFQTIYEAINQVDNAQQTNYAEILKYIRFENGNIILGEVNNPITLTLENDVLYFEQNGTRVAYFENNRFYVMDGEFGNSLRIGNFMFAPRTNGNLSLKKVGEIA